VPMTAGEPTVVELRVPGFSGTTAESLLDAVATVDVAGDGIGRVVRPADQLRRPAPGAPLVAGGRTVPRIVEGYLWGAMTSGGWAKATWALLLPFALSNVAHWMLPPLPAGGGPGRAIGLLLRSLLRAVSLLLTCLLIGQFTLLSLDLVAAQCLAPGTDCLAGTVPGWAREVPELRAAAGLLPVLALVWLLHRLSGTDWSAPEPGPGTAPAGAALPGVTSWLPAMPLAGDPDTPTLRALHTMAGLATAALLALGGPYGPVSAGVTGPWLVALGLLAVAGAGTVLLDDPTGAFVDRGGAWVRAVLGRWQRRILLATGGALLLATTALLPMPAAPLPGADDTLEWLSALLTVLCGAMAVLLVPAARLGRPAWAALPRGMRPWAGGWAAAPVVALAVLVGTGFGAGLALTLRRMLGAPQLQLPAVYTAITLVWGAAGVVLAAGALLASLALTYRQWQLTRGRAAPPAEVPLLHPPAQQAAVASAWWRADLMRYQAYRVMVAGTGVLVLLVGAVWAVHLASIELPEWTRTVSAFGVTVLAALAAGVLGAVYRAARQPDAARRLGQLWDLVSFWPREAHPAVPPAYPLKVVPDLVRRAREHLADQNTRVVLVGHSQGSLLAAMAAARLLAELPPADRDRVGLVTAGSQLQWAYPRAFPAVVPHSCLAELSRALGGRWRALCRGTDPIGGAVTTWHRYPIGGALHGRGLRDDGTDAPLPAATASPSGALVLGGDHWLPDPARDPVPGRRWHPGILGHRDYQADPEWDRAVVMAAGLASGGVPTGNGRPDPLHAVPPHAP